MYLQAAGHFKEVPALPAATLGANLMRLISLGFPGADGQPANLTVLRHRLKNKRLPFLGDSLIITCTRQSAEQDCTDVIVCIVEKHTAHEVMTGNILVKMH
jgi:hypothetical protein